MTTYYVSALTGSDKNSGTDEKQPFASLAAINSLKLKPGDSVLLAADSVFHEQLNVKSSGSDGNPIKFGSYGIGAAPVITGGDVGIYGSKAAHIVIDNITISATKGNAIYAGSAKDWVVNHVTVIDTGSSTRAGSISFQSSENIKIANSSLSGVNGDGIWMLNVKGASVTDTTVKNSFGHDADAIQMNRTSDILIKGNHLDMSGITASAKGVLALVEVKSAVIDDNVLVGGGFGVGAYGEDITISHNDISGFGGYNWSFGIGLGAQIDSKNYDITGNYVHGGVFGVSVSAPGTDGFVRQGIEIKGNFFADLSASALKVDRAASGSFHDNVIADDVKVSKISAAIAAQKTFEVSNNSSVDPAIVHAAAVASPVKSNSLLAVDDRYHMGVDALEHSITGNILSNDQTGNGNLFLRRFDGLAVEKAGKTLVGDYGTLHIELNGDFVYTLKQDIAEQPHSVLHESFYYKISNVAEIDTGAVSFTIDALAVPSHYDGILL